MKSVSFQDTRMKNCLTLDCTLDMGTPSSWKMDARRRSASSRVAPPCVMVAPGRFWMPLAATTIYCMPDNVDCSFSQFQSCRFSVCGIRGAVFASSRVAPPCVMVAPGRFWMPLAATLP